MVQTLQDRTVGSVQLALMVLLGAVVLVLLIACANVANLVIVRGAARQSELAVRVAMGAGYRGVLSYLLAENVLLGLAGGLGGLSLAAWGIDALKLVAPARRHRGERRHRRQLRHRGQAEPLHRGAGSVAGRAVGGRGEHHRPVGRAVGDPRADRRAPRVRPGGCSLDGRLTGRRRPGTGTGAARGAGWVPLLPPPPPAWPC